MGDLDLTAVRDFAGDLREAGPSVRRKVSGSLTRHTNKIRKSAQQRAGKDRPWLSTDMGIQRDTRTMSRRIYSPPDETRADGKPHNVGMHQELGTSRLLARPFLAPALAAHRDEFVSDVGRIIDEAV